MRGLASRLAAMTVTALVASGVALDAQQNVLRPNGPAASRIASLTDPVLIAFAAIALVMWALIAWVALRRTGSFESHVAWDDPGSAGYTWILVGGFIAPALVFGVMFFAMLHVMGAVPERPDGQTTSDIRIVGHQWWWEVHYLSGGGDVVSANEVHIPAGRPVDIELVSDDVIHSFWVPELHGKVDLIPGLTNHIRVEADQPGVFRGQCAEYCGAEHGMMKLVVDADPPEGYQAWLDHERDDAAPPATGDLQRGQAIFLSHQCALCHSIRGTAAHGQIGPDLTHIGSRKGIAANAFDNDTADLAAWVTHAQSLKPESRMPDITAFSGAELRLLVGYLQSLK